MTSTELRLREGAVSWQEVDGEAVLLDLRTSEYLGVNPSGTVLWRLLAEGTTAEALRGALVDRFPVAPERAAADVAAFVADARSHGLLEE